MSEPLPHGWTASSLSKTGTWKGGGTPSKANSEFWENGTVHWVSPKDMKRLRIDSAQNQITEAAVRSSATNLIPADSVLIVTRSGILEHTLPVAINTVPVTINQDIKAWTPARGVNPTYAAYYLRSRGRQILDECSKDGTTVSSIDFDRLASFQFDIAPTNEQARVVSKIDELFSHIDEGERALERVHLLVERYRQSVLKAAVTGELTLEWREQNADRLASGAPLLRRIQTPRGEVSQQVEEKAFADRRGGHSTRDLQQLVSQEQLLPNGASHHLPHGWILATLPMLCGEGTSNGISVKGSDLPPGVPALRLDAMLADGFDYSARRYIPIDERTASRLKIEEGDYFVSRANGSIKLVGRAVLAQAPNETIVFPDTMIRYRLIDKSLGEWIALIWSSAFVRAQIEKKAKTTAGIYKISQNDIAEIWFPMPPQHERDHAVSQVRRAMRGVQKLTLDGIAARRYARTLRQSILTDAFAGALVPQNPTDEPASALLERIASERASVVTVAPRARTPNSKKRA